ncbi:MAG TPA: ATP-binding protein [Patescibacteria group bacterium]|nr:ATP-binding protein [Patescibacteria group bacterium]
MRSSVSELPPRFRDRTLESFEPGTPSQRAALGGARAVLAGEIRSLVLVGPPGVGKTHLAAGIFAACRFRARWVNVADALTTMRSEIGLPPEDRETTRAIHGTAGHRGLVVLDDLGRENTTDWSGEMIYALVNGRYEHLLPTVVTSNRTPADLRAGPYWPAISRLAEDGRLIVVAAPDHRMRKRAVPAPSGTP